MAEPWHLRGTHLTRLAGHQLPSAEQGRARAHGGEVQDLLLASVVGLCREHPSLRFGGRARVSLCCCEACEGFEKCMSYEVLDYVLSQTYGVRVLEFANIISPSKLTKLP